MGAYILDFYCPAAKLAVEIDGATHAEPAQQAHDARRDQWLYGQGLTVERISATWVYEDVDEAADAMRRLAMELCRKSGGHRGPRDVEDA